MAMYYVTLTIKLIGVALSAILYGIAHYADDRRKVKSFIDDTRTISFILFLAHVALLFI